VRARGGVPRGYRCSLCPVARWVTVGDLEDPSKAFQAHYALMHLERA